MKNEKVEINLKNNESSNVIFSCGFSSFSRGWPKNALVNLNLLFLVMNKNNNNNKTFLDKIKMWFRWYATSFKIMNRRS